jgi:7-cyano-7-deazaguanine synthase
MTPRDSGALVLFSGGQDSTTCLAWALERYRRVETIGFSYGQRHAVELEVRAAIRTALFERFPTWSSRLGVDHLVTVDALGRVSRSALIDDSEFGTRADGLPTTFVPGRNLVFFTFAAIAALERGIKTLVAGMCETDNSGYPDCRDDAIKALQVALNLGMAAGLTIETPLMKLDKSQSWTLAEHLGGQALVEILLELTHTCYRGDRSHRHTWGYGCNACEACVLRRRGWERYAGLALRESAKCIGE